MTLIILLTVVFTSSTITTRIKAQAEHARKKRKHAELLYSINRKLLSTKGFGYHSKILDGIFKG